MIEPNDAAEILRRYLIVRAIFEGGEFTGPAKTDLEYEAKPLRTLTRYGVFLNRNATPPLAGDERNPEFFNAMNGTGGYAGVDASYMDQLREHVFRGAQPPDASWRKQVVR